MTVTELQRRQVKNGRKSAISVTVTVIDKPQRITANIGVDAWSVNEAQRVGSCISSHCWILEAVPVIDEAWFQHEPLTGEAGVEGGCSGDSIGFAKGFKAGFPDFHLAGVRHHDGALQMIYMHMVEFGGG